MQKKSNRTKGANVETVVGLDKHRDFHDATTGTDREGARAHGGNAAKIHRRRYDDFHLVLWDTCELMYLGRDYQWQHVVTNKAIWDTGAMGTAITKEMADRLGAVVTEWHNVGSAGGNMTAGVIMVNLGLGDIVIPMVQVKVLDLTEREREAERLGIPYHHPDVWIGMDVIVQGRLEVDATGEAVELTFEME